MEVVPALLHGLGSELRAAAFESGSVSLAQFRTLIALHHGPRSLNELASFNEVSPPAVSRLISTLVERGWVQRVPDPADRRQVILTLTSAGEESWSALSKRGVEHLAAMLDQLSDEEIAGLEVALVGLARVLAARQAEKSEMKPS